MDQLPTDAFLQQQRFTRSTHRNVYPFISPSNPSLSQHNRIIVITGASQGLGHLAFARSFAAAGAKALVLGARNTVKLELVRQDLFIEFPDVEVVVEQLYVEQSASQVQFWSVVKRKFVRADVLCSNAGIDPGNATIKILILGCGARLWWNVNIKGHFLSCHHFLKLLAMSTENIPTNPTIIDTSSGFAVLPPVPGFSTNAISKLAGVQLCNYIAAEHPEVMVVALHPGIVHTNIVDTAFSWAKHMALDTHELVGGTALLLTTPEAKFLSGRFVCANWDMEELFARKEEIIKQDKLKMTLKGEFGSQQFETE